MIRHMSVVTLYSGEKDYPQTVAANIRAEAARRGLNQTELASLLGVAKATVSLKWRGGREWSLSDVAKVAKVLNVAVEDLLRTRRDSNPQPADPEFVAPVYSFPAAALAKLGGDRRRRFELVAS